MSLDRRIVVLGGPGTGKTTLAKALALATTRSTDEVKHLEWSAASEEVSKWFDEPGPWLVEGVTTARALRKWLGRSPTGSPCDQLVFLSSVYEIRTTEQRTMAKGVATVWREIRRELIGRGCNVVAARDVLS